MEEIRLGSKAIHFEHPTWNGFGFKEAAAEALWKKLPTNLKSVVESEVRAGNQIRYVLHNLVKDIVVLGLVAGPLVDHPQSTSIRIHTTHALGNYCYDDTNATYEDLSSGCLVSFDGRKDEETAV